MFIRIGSCKGLGWLLSNRVLVPTADIDTVLSNGCPFYPYTLKKLWLGVTASLNYIISTIKKYIKRAITTTKFFLQILPSRQTGQLFEALKHEAPVSYHLAKNNVCVCVSVLHKLLVLFCPKIIFPFILQSKEERF